MGTFNVSTNSPLSNYVYKQRKLKCISFNFKTQAAGHRIHEAAAQQSQHRPGDRESRRADQEGDAAPEEARAGGNRGERDKDLSAAGLRQRRGRGLQGAGEAAEGGGSVCCLRRDHAARGQGEKGTRQALPVGSRRGGES